MLDSTDGPDQVFDCVSNRRLRGLAALAGGVALVVVATAGFVLSLRTSPNIFAFHMMTTMPMILAVGLFATAFATLRSPTRVIISQHDLAVFRGQTEFGRWRWEQLAHTSGIQSSFNAKRMLKLYGESGKVLVRLSDDLRDFDTIAAEIKRRMTENPSAQRTKIAHHTGRRKGLGLMIGGVLFFALAIANGWMATHDRQAKDLLLTQGQPAHATVMRKFTAPDGHTRRIEYKVDTPNAPTENVEVAPGLWAILREHQRIPVTAVPGRPDISHLKAGQIDDSMQADPKVMLLLSIAIAFISIVFFVAGALSWRGLELKWDKERSRPRFARIGDE
jgi:hypothetical protein